MSVRSETDLLTSPRECIFCNKNGLHNYHMLVDHLHTNNQNVKRDIINVRLDADCSFCQSVGRPTCCVCIDNFKDRKYQILKGYYISICDDCCVLYDDRMVENSTYRYCVICNLEHDCPSCFMSNNEEFENVDYSYYQNKYIECNTCKYTYRPKDTILF